MKMIPIVLLMLCGCIKKKPEEPTWRLPEEILTEEDLEDLPETQLLAEDVEEEDL